MSELAFGTAQPLALLRCSGKRKTAGGATRRLVSGLDGENGYRHEKPASLQALLQQTGVLEVSGKGKKREDARPRNDAVDALRTGGNGSAERTGRRNWREIWKAKRSRREAQNSRKEKEKRDPGEERKERRNKLKRRRGCGLSCPVLSCLVVCCVCESQAIRMPTRSISKAAEAGTANWGGSN